MVGEVVPKGDSKTDGGLSKILKNLYDYILSHPGINVHKLSEALNRPVDTLDKQVKKLIDKDLVERKGSRKTGGYWVR